MPASEESIHQVLVLGGTGTIGREVVAELQRRGLAARTLTRDPDRARGLLGDGPEIVAGDLTQADDLRAAPEGVDAVVLTHGAPYGSGLYEEIDYGAIPHLLEALDGRVVPVALMTSIGASRASHAGPTGLLAWKRDGERLLRSSGLPCAVVRPGWFGAGPQDRRAQLVQGDAADSGSVAPEHVAQALVQGVLGRGGYGRTVEVFSGPGQPLATDQDWATSWEAAEPDAPGARSAARDQEPPEPDPDVVAADLARFTGAFRA